MTRRVSVVAVLMLAVLLTACGGSSTRPGGQPNPTGQGDIAITARREDDMASIWTPLLRWLSPKAHAVETPKTKVRFVVWDPNTGVKVMRDVDMVAGEARASLRTPARLGYRVATIEWDEETQSVVSWGLEPSVDILPDKPVVLQMGMRTMSSSSAKPLVTVWRARARGGEDVMGSITIPLDFTVAGFGMRAITDHPACYWASQLMGYEVLDSVPPPRIDWRLPVPILQTSESVTCEFAASVGTLEGIPQGFGTEDMPDVSIVINEPIVVTFDPPEIVIE